MNTQTIEFTSLRLSAASLNALKRMGFTHPTPIQARAIPPALEGKDVIGCAATGTGKTAAFLLPLLERLDGKRGTRALILAPTRELVDQIADQLEKLGHGRTIRGVSIIGGVGMGGQQEALRRQHEVIIATPGRLLDHMDRGDASLKDLELLVLDEADRMLDMGFRPQLNRIMAKVPRVRQTMLFSATMAGEVAEFASKHLKDPVRVEVARSGTTAARAEQQVFLCAQEEKTPLLLTLLDADTDSTLVFTRTKHRADKVARALERAGHSVSRIHGNRSQSQRRASLEGFRDGTHRVLVATDIAARGIDVEAIGHVVLYDLPHVPEDYVHRVGRTARAAAAGRASSFCAPDEADLLRAIERLTRLALPRATVPRDAPIFTAARQAQATRQPVAERPHGQRQHGGPSQPGRNKPGHAKPTGHKPARARSSGTSSGSGAAARGVKLGSWKPRRR
ncbi:MAG: DEAD/DEAH box helicase [Myxococcota bacterium]